MGRINGRYLASYSNASNQEEWGSVMDARREARLEGRLHRAAARRVRVLIGCSGHAVAAALASARRGRIANAHWRQQRHHKRARQRHPFPCNARHTDSLQIEPRGAVTEITLDLCEYAALLLNRHGERDGCGNGARRSRRSHRKTQEASQRRTVRVGSRKNRTRDNRG